MAFGDVVQSNEGTGSTATTNATLSSSPTAGNLIVLAFAGDDYNGTPNSPWTQPTGGEQQTYHGGYLWYHISDGSNSYQYTIGSNSPSVWVIAEIEGPFDSTPLDVSNGTLSTAGGNSLATPSVTPSTGDRAALATYGASSGSALNTRTATFSNSFTTIRDIGASTGGTKDFIALGVRTLTGNGSTGYTTTGTISAGGSPDSQSAIIAVFKKGAGGGGSQSITGALYTNSNTFYGATVAPGTATVSGGLFTNSQTFYGATVGRGAVNIGGALYTNSNGFFGGTVSASYTIQGALFTDGDTFYGATVSPGSVTIGGVLFSNSNAFYAAAVSQDGAPQNISGALYANTQTVYAASVAAKYSVAGALYSDPDTFFAATVSQPVAQNISGARYDNDNSFFGAVVGGKRDTGGSGNQTGRAKRRRNINDDPDAFAELLEEWREKKRKKQAKDEEKQEVSQSEPDTIGPELYRQLLALEQAYERSMEAAEKLVSKRNVRAAMTAAKELEDAQAAYQAALDEEDEEIIALFAA